MPLAQFSPIFWYLIIYPPLFLAAWVAMRHLNFTAREIGFNARKLPLQLTVALTGVIFGGWFSELQWRLWGSGDYPMSPLSLPFST